jgi:predicted Rossmann fold flavoprotein
LSRDDKSKYSTLSGIAIDAEISTGITSTGETVFRENLLFTHRGLSGPGILQISNYWKPGTEVRINLLPGVSVSDLLESSRSDSPELTVKGLLSRHLPKRLVEVFIPPASAGRALKTLNAGEVSRLSDLIHNWRIIPSGTEGSRSAEVTRGGIDVDTISSKTFEAQSVPGLYFIGEVLDVTGRLGGYNLQWAWSSGWCAGQFV